MLHADKCGNLSDSKYNPITDEQIELSGFDYVALGHIHDFSGINYSGKTFYAYSGVHEPHGFDECGQKGVVYGCVGKGVCRLSLKDTSLRTYESLDIDVTELKTFDDILAEVRSFVSSKKSLYRINLTGFIDDNVFVDCELMETLIDAFYIKIINNTHHRYNLDLIANENGLKGYIAKNVLKELTSCTDNDVDTVCAASDYLFEIIDSGD